MISHHRALKENARKNRFSKFIVVLSILTLLTYVGISMYFVRNGWYLPSELTYATFAFFGTEMIALAYINGKGKDVDKEVQKHEHDRFHNGGIL